MNGIVFLISLSGLVLLMYRNVLNTGASQYTRQMLTTIKGEINSNTVIVGDFNTSLISMSR